MGNENSVKVIKDDPVTASEHPTLEVTMNKVNYESVTGESSQPQDINSCDAKRKAFQSTRPLSLETYGTSPKEGWTRGLWRSLRGRSLIKRKRSEDEETGPTSLEIRQEYLKQMAERRPAISHEQLRLISETWSILQRDTEGLGLEMFSR